MPTSAIAERFERTCRTRGEAVAVLSLSTGRGTTFTELCGQYLSIRQTLQRLGVGPGSCVVSLVGNRPQFFSVFVACLDVGALLLPLGEATDAEAVTLVRETGAVAVISDRALPITPVEEARVDDDVRVTRVADRPGWAPQGRSLVMKLTSGSTALPKAALASEQILIGEGQRLTGAMGIGPGDINLTVVPLSHAYALGNVVMPLVLQGTAAAIRTAFSPSQFVRDALTSQATVFPGVPFMFERLRGLLSTDGFPPGVRLLITAGARVDVGTLRWFRDRANRKIHSLYGTSETGGITYDDTEEVADPLHVGRPLPDMAVEIRREPDTTGVGRIFVRGPGVGLGYAQTDGADSPAAFQDGGFLTGDLGYLNSDGCLVLTGRVSPLINVAGRKVDPAEVERVLVGLPGVTDARVLGVSCDRRDQELVAFVVGANPPLAPIAIRQLCANTLSPYKIPRRFVFLERWPVDARGKMDRQALEALATTDRGA
jgi:acyl-CoA synthetase (AMP-forming)/AMP-acid ligase II